MYTIEAMIYYAMIMIYYAMSIILSHIAILTIKWFDYCCIISLISKNEAIKLLQNADLTKKVKDYENRWKNLNA